jgi:hypothetical protein
LFTAYNRLDDFTEEDRQILSDEVNHKWKQTKTLYYVSVTYIFASHSNNLPLQMVIMSSLAAAVQGMDEAVINGAQIIYPAQFGIGDATSSKHPSFIFDTT